MSRTATLAGGAVAALTLLFLDHRNLALVAVAAAVAASGLLRGRRAGPVLSPTSATLDHIIPHSRGGSDDPEQMVTACHRCNTSKGNRTPEEWAAGVVVDSTARERAEIPAEVRLAVYARDDFRCRYCGVTVD